MVKKKVVQVEPVIVQVDTAPVQPAETIGSKRKPYPTHQERMVMADKKVAHIEALLAQRKILLERAQAIVEERRESVEKTEAMLQSAVEKRVRIEGLLNRPVKTALPRGRRVGSLRKLKEALNASGKTVEELLAMLNAQQDMK